MVRSRLRAQREKTTDAENALSDIPWRNNNDPHP
jgi:hypothetical protein